MKYFLTILSLFTVLILKAQQTDHVDFKQAQAYLSLDPIAKTVSGDVVFKLEILKDTDSIYVDAVNMEFSEVNLTKLGVHVDVDYVEFELKNNGQTLVIHEKFLKDEVFELRVKYVAKPKKAIYFVGWENEAPDQIWTQGQGKYTSNWLPSLDDMNDKMEFDLKIQFNKPYQVIANGKLTDLERLGHSDTYVWHYDMKQPMSSYLVALAIGDYDKKVAYSKSGVPLEMYYYPEDSAKFEPTYRYTKPMFDYLEEEIGVPYPWQDYKQVPVQDFLYAGMENTSLTIFADSFVTDSIGFNDRNYVNVNAHELAHQWFGNLVTETSGTHHWLHEGFATYYALLAEKKFFGDDYYYWQLLKTAQQLEAQDISGKSTALLDPKSNSLTFYHKGAWALVMLRDKVGDQVFRKAIKAYLLEHQFSNVSTQEFLYFIEEFGDVDLTEYAFEWLRNDDFPIDQAIEYLKSKSTFIHEYIMADCEVINSKCYEYLSSGLSDEAKVKVITQQPSLINKQAFKNGLKVRQSIAQTLQRIPMDLKEDYEGLLNDDSYITKEIALFNLWNNFEEDRHEYLDKIKGLQGFGDKNLRILWLTLALITDGYESENDELFYKELLGYTSSNHGFETRQNAFRSLAWIMSCGEECKENLNEATAHHNWRFSKFAKNLLKQLK